MSALHRQLQIADPRVVAVEQPIQVGIGREETGAGLRLPYWVKHHAASRPRCRLHHRRLPVASLEGSTIVTANRSVKDG